MFFRVQRVALVVATGALVLTQAAAKLLVFVSILWCLWSHLLLACSSSFSLLFWRSASSCGSRQVSADATHTRNASLWTGIDPRKPLLPFHMCARFDLALSLSLHAVSKTQRHVVNFVVGPAFSVGRFEITPCSCWPVVPLCVVKPS